MIAELANAGSVPVLAEMMRFSAQRQKLLAHNIANVDTPNFVQKDVSATSFQAALAGAVAERRARTGGEGGAMRAVSTREVQRGADGSMVLVPRAASGRGGIMYHDRNNRDIERMMQDLTENGMAFRLASDLMRRQQDILRTAISQRVG
jgi:flagellar basal-body rod protein FlgB